MWELADAIMSAANRRPDSPVAAVVAHWTNGVTCWFGGDYLNARMHLEQALAIYGAEPNLETFRASTLDLPFVIMRFLALVLWPIGQIDRARRLAAEAVRAREKSERFLRPMRSFIRRFSMDYAGAVTANRDDPGTRSRPRPHDAVVCSSGTYLNGLAKWRAGDREAGLAEMRRGWTLLHENDCYLCEPFWGMQVAVANAAAGQLTPGWKF